MIYDNYYKCKNNKSKAEKHSLDSTISGGYQYSPDFIPGGKTIYGYDESGFNNSVINLEWSLSESSWIFQNKLGYNIVADSMEVLSYLWDTVSNDWKSQWRDIYLYDAQGNLIEYREYYKVGMVGPWFLSSLTIKEYNEFNKIIADYHLYRYDEYSPLVYDFKEVYTYNEQNKLIDRRISYWDVDISEWYDVCTTIYIYNDQGLLANSQFFATNTGVEGLVNVEKTDYDYNNENKMISQSNYSWDDITESWIGTQKFAWSYNTELNSIIKYEYEFIDGDWSYKYFVEDVFNDESQLFSEKHCYYELEHTQWLNSMKYENIYDELGNVYYRPNYGWDWITSDWKLDSKYERLYCNLYSLDDLITPSYIAYDEVELFSQMILENLYSYLVEDVNMIKHSKKMYFWSNTDFSLLEKEIENVVEIFPNPCNSEIYTNLSGILGVAALKIYSLQGCLIKSCEIQNDSKISVESLSDGIYIYRIVGDGKVYTGKFVKN
jgi:hypothetical protein